MPVSLRSVLAWLLNHEQLAAPTGAALENLLAGVEAGDAEEIWTSVKALGDIIVGQLASASTAAQCRVEPNALGDGQLLNTLLNNPTVEALLSALVNALIGKLGAAG